MPLTPAQLEDLHVVLGPTTILPVTPALRTQVSARMYNAYRAAAQLISMDDGTARLYATLAAGAPDSIEAAQGIPKVRRALGQTGNATGAIDTGVPGQAASAHDISGASRTDLTHIVPTVLFLIGILLAGVLRSLVAPLYLLISVGLSHLAALGLTVALFMRIRENIGVNLVLPFLMFIFLMALGSDYNILVMTRIREEAQESSLPRAVTSAIEGTGGAVTSTGVILAGTFLVLTVSAGAQAQQVGFGIAGGILLDTFLVRTIMIPSMAVLLGRWNWWPSRLVRKPRTVHNAA